MGSRNLILELYTTQYYDIKKIWNLFDGEINTYIANLKPDILETQRCSTEYPADTPLTSVFNLSNALKVKKM